MNDVNNPRTAESVTPNHPDKICDRISDAILDECLRQDPMSRVAVETMGGHGIITITGEITTKAFADFNKVARRIVGEKYGITVNIVSQSPEIASGVDTGGAGDQGIMRGYACDDNEQMIPQEHFLSRNLGQYIFERFPFDGKTQITLGDNGEIKTALASFQNAPAGTLKTLIIDWLAEKGLLATEIKKVEILANTAGDWNIGGFEADTGLTGRKLVVDNYGPEIPLGGGCFSGKDASKVDRSAAYMARKIAVDYLRDLKARGEKNIKVWTKLAYAIGRAEPVMAMLEWDTEDGCGRENILIGGKYDLTPKGIIEFLKLREPQFEKTAEWGHMGNGFEWDR